MLITPACKLRKTSDVVPVREVRDSTLPGPAGNIPIRIYSPAPADAGPQAGLVYFHGGAFEVHCNFAVKGLTVHTHMATHLYESAT